MRVLLPKTKALRVFALAVTMASFALSARPDSFTFSALPASGKVASSAGSAVGWGFSISNEGSADWLVTTNLTADPFLNGTPTVLFDFPFLAPGQAITESYDPATSSGLYGLIWDLNALTGSVDSGNFVLNAEWWSGDPTGTGVFIADATSASAPYSAVVGGGPSIVAEPSTFLLLVCSSLVFLASTSPRLRLKTR